MGNRKIQLKVVHQPAAYTTNILEINQPETIFFIGHGYTNLLCGKCNAVLAESIDENSLNNMALKCNKCQSYNLIPYKRTQKSA